MDRLLRLLWKRISEWRAEIGWRIRPPSRPKLQDALTMAQKHGVDPVLFVLIVAMCERWFRVHLPTPNRLEKKLQTKLLSPSYTPYSPNYGETKQARTPMSQAVDSYLDYRLREQWDPDASEEMSHFIRNTVKASIKNLARDWAAPFLVADKRPLPRKRGAYPQWGPWVAASVLYADVRARCPRRRDARALNCAITLLEALLGRKPDKAQFGRTRRKIQRRAPKLLDEMMSDLRAALKAYENPRWRVEFLLETGTLDSLEEWGGMHLF